MIGFQYSAEAYKFAELNGIRMSDYYSDVRLMVAAQKKAHQIISDALDVPAREPFLTRGHVRCPEYMGCAIYWPEDDEPFVKSPVLTDIHQVSRFKYPDPPDNPVAVEHLATARQFYEITGLKMSISGFEGPFTTAAFMRGQTEFLVDLVDQPSLCERLIAKVTSAIIDWKTYHDAEMGIGKEEATALVDDSIPLISPGDFRDMVLPHHLRWFDAFPSSQRHFHCCGDVTRHLNELAKLDLTHCDMMGDMMRVADMRQAFKTAYLSQLYDFRILRDCGEDEIKAATNRMLDQMRTENNYGIVVEGIRGVPLHKARSVRDRVAEFNGGELPTFNKLNKI